MTMEEVIAEGYACYQCQMEIDKSYGEIHLCKGCSILEARL